MHFSLFDTSKLFSFSVFFIIIIILFIDKLNKKYYSLTVSKFDKFWCVGL